MKEIGYQQTHQCGITGFVTVAWGLCGAILLNGIYMSTYTQAEVERRVMVVLHLILFLNLKDCEYCL